MTLGIMARIFISMAVLGAPPASKPTPAVSLRWDVTCMERETAVARLRELIPSLPPELPRDDGRMSVAVEFVDSTARVSFAGDLGDGTRTIEGEECATLAQAAVLVVAVAIDPVVSAESIWPSPAQGTPDERTAHPAPEDPEPAQLASRIATEDRTARRAKPPQNPSLEEAGRSTIGSMARSTSRGHVAVLGGVGYGPVDGGFGMLVVEAGANGRWWRVSARGIFALPRRLNTGAAQIARINALIGGLRGCAVPPLVPHKLELPLCVGIEGGALRGRGVQSTPNPLRASQPWVAADIGLGLRYSPSRIVSLAAEVGPAFALLRGGFSIDGDIVASHVPVGVRGLAGLEVRFP